MTIVARYTEANMSQKKILCIEDDTFLLELISGKFVHAGIIAIGAHTGAEGLVLATNEKPDIILLDLMLPDMKGAEVMRRIKADATTKDIPVIIFSNLSDKEEIKASLSHGASAYYVKSNTLPGEIVEIVAKQLGVDVVQVE